MKTLKERIEEEMTSDYSNSLEKNFEVAKTLIKITKEGNVEILNKSKLNLEDQISLYLIGKLYSLEVGYSKTDRVNNEEFKNELGLSEGSVLPTLKKLRDGHKIKQDLTSKPTSHYFSVNLIETTLNTIINKIKEK